MKQRRLAPSTKQSPAPKTTVKHASWLRLSSVFQYLHLPYKPWFSDMATQQRQSPRSISVAVSVATLPRREAGLLSDPSAPPQRRNPLATSPRARILRCITGIGTAHRVTESFALPP